MGLFDIFKKKKNDEFLEMIEKEVEIETSKQEEVIEENLDDLVLIEGELADLTEGVLNTDSKIAIEKFKHNLSILMEEAKANNRVNKFMIIREDDFFPEGWEWKVNSDNTSIEYESLNISSALKKQYVLEKFGLERELNGISLPVSEDEIYKHLSKIDKRIGSVLVPTRFRSTKHFTINTPLGITGNYNSVPNDRDYIVIDDMNNFLNSGYAYSVAYHDAYLDVSHEALPISENAVVLIREDSYENLIKDPTIKEELELRKVILFKGDKDIAIDMVLTSLGTLPSSVGTKYAIYDNNLNSIIDKSIKNLAEEHGLFYDRSHAGDIAKMKGHFSNYYDDKNEDYNEAIRNFIRFLSDRFPEYSTYFNYEFSSPFSYRRFPLEIVKKIGTQNLLDTINEYNSNYRRVFETKLENYKNDRKSITPEIHKVFTDTVQLINEFYRYGVKYKSAEEQLLIESTIRQFFHESTVEQQLNAASALSTLINLEEETLEDTMEFTNEEQLPLKTKSS